MILTIANEFIDYRTIKMSSQQLAKQEQLKPFLLASQRQITSLLQDDAKAKRFMAASLVVASTPSLNKCNPESIVQALIGVAMSDLNIDSNIGHCYLVPYGDSVQLQIGYKGFIQLLYRAGWLVKAFPVYTVDDFSIEFDGWDNKVQFSPNIDGRDEGDKDWVFNNLRGIYVVSRNAETKDEYSLFVNKSVIEKLRLNSPNQKITNWTKDPDKKLLEAGKPVGIWRDWYVEMAQAKAIKKIAKTLPIGDARASQAIAADDKAEQGKKVDYKQSAESGLVIESTVVDDESTSKDDPYALGATLSLISNSSSTEELNAIDIRSLKADEQKKAKTAWLKKQGDLLKNTELMQEAKRPIDETKEASWEDRIADCHSTKELTDLLRVMPESVQMDLGDMIDMEFDSYR